MPFVFLFLSVGFQFFLLYLVLHPFFQYSGGVEAQLAGVVIFFDTGSIGDDWKAEESVLYLSTLRTNAGGVGTFFFFWRQNG